METPAPHSAFLPFPMCLCFREKKSIKIQTLNQKQKRKVVLQNSCYLFEGKLSCLLNNEV